ncbi:MAG TPA: hypothetical protein V6C52_11750 [Coleofasciculaceae cyanobacterium]|jgi:hypothetical protein
MSTFPQLQGSNFAPLVRQGTFTGNAQSLADSIREVGQETINFAIRLHPDYKLDSKQPPQIDQFVKADTFFINDGLRIDQNGNVKKMKNEVISLIWPLRAASPNQESLSFPSYQHMAKKYQELLMAQKYREDRLPDDPKLILEGNLDAYA